MCLKKPIIMFTAYNDAETLPALIRAVRDHTHTSATVLVVNDGSTDDTVHTVTDLDCEAIHLEPNQGVGAAYKAGFEHILTSGEFTHVIKIDADGQHQPRFIPQILSYLYGGADIVTCSRFHPHSHQNGTMLDRVMLNSMFTRELRAVTGWNITDARTGFFGLPTALLKDIMPRLITKRYGVPMEVLLRLWRIRPNAQHIEIPHPALYRDHGNTRRAEQYRAEDYRKKQQRFLEAFGSLLAVYEDMGITAQHLIQAMRPGISIHDCS